jgi:hypothetical protein
MQMRRIPHTAGCFSATFAASDPSLYRWTGGGGSPSLFARGGAPPRAFWTGGGVRTLCTRRGSALTPPANPLTAKAPGPRDLLLGRALTVRAVRLEHAREILEAGLGEEDRAAAVAELALTDVGVAVAV